MKAPHTSSLPGLTRQSIGPHRQWQSSMDARVKPAHDEGEDCDHGAENVCAARCSSFPPRRSPGSSPGSRERGVAAPQTIQAARLGCLIFE
jgi:hypothetical protein